MKNPTWNPVQIKEFIEGEAIRGRIREDGGDIACEGVRDTTVLVCLKAACASCPSGSRTVKHFVEPKVKALFGGQWTVQARLEKPYFSR